MTSSYTTVGKELQKVKNESGSPVAADTKDNLHREKFADAKRNLVIEKCVDAQPEKKMSPKLRVAPADMRMLSQNLAGPQIILDSLDNALDTLKNYVAKAQKRVSDLEVEIKTARPTDDSIIKEYTYNITSYFSMSDESIRLTNEKIRIVSDAIGNILEMKRELGNCQEFTVEHINDPQHPISSLLYYLFILISEHSEILKQAFAKMNTDKLGQSLGNAINYILEKPLQLASEYSCSGELEKKLTALTKSLTLTYPDQASAAKKAVEDLMLQEAKNTIIPSHIKRLDDYIKKTSADLSKKDIDNPAELTGKKLKLAIDLRAELKYLTRHSMVSESVDRSALELQKIAVCILEFSDKHSAMTGEVLPASINNTFGNSVGSWINYLFGTLITPASQFSYRGRLGSEFSITLQNLNTQFPGVVDAARTQTQNHTLKVK